MGSEMCIRDRYRSLLQCNGKSLQAGICGICTDTAEAGASERKGDRSSRKGAGSGRETYYFDFFIDKTAFCHKKRGAAFFEAKSGRKNPALFYIDKKILNIVHIFGRH